MNATIKPYLLAALFLTNAFVSCNQSEKTGDQRFDQKAIALNDSAVKIQMNFMSLNISKDSVFKVIDLWKQAIKIDPGYQTAYLNLWNFNNSMQLFNENIPLSSDWLKNQPNNPDILIKRGLVYEQLGKTDLSNRDYEAALLIISAKPVPAINKDMTQKQIAEAISRAFNIFIIKKDSKEPLEVLSKLQALFPKDTKVDSGYEALKSSTRAEYINTILGQDGLLAHT